MEPNQMPVSAPAPQPPAASTPPQASATGALTGPVELLTASWKFFKANWKVLVPIVIIPSVISYFGSLLTVAGGAGLGILSFILFILSLILGVAMQPAALDAVRRLTLEPGTVLSVQGQYRLGFKYFWPVVFLIILQILIMLGSVVALFVPAVIVGVYGGFYILALVLDGKRGFAAFTESYGLVRGRWWAVFGRILFLALIFLLVSLVVAGIGFLLNAMFGFVPASSGRGAVSSLLSLISNAIVAPLALVYVYNLYGSLRSTRGAAVATSAFKKWLIAFMCIGIAAAIAVPIVGGIVIARYASQFVNNVSNVSVQGSMMIRDAGTDGTGGLPAQE